MKRYGVHGVVIVTGTVEAASADHARQVVADALRVFTMPGLSVRLVETATRVKGRVSQPGRARPVRACFDLGVHGPHEWDSFGGLRFERYFCGGVTRGELR